MLTYEKILKSSQKFKISLGLNRVQKILELFNNPQNDMDFIHVAGTNGKGSVCAVLEAILLFDGQIKIGKYTSPHLFDYTERFSINGENIAQNELDELVKIVLKKDEENKIGLTEFEILTVVCFLYFKRHNVRLAIIETGLGGRFDATNVIKKPLVSIITSISYDHTARLGNTIEKIAFEKAGIIKPGCPVVFLEENAGYKTLLDTALKCNAKVFKTNLNVTKNGDTAIINNVKSPFYLTGDFQAENLKLALSGLIAAGLLSADNFSAPVVHKFKPVTFETVKSALSKVKWRFRMEKINYKGCNLLVDGCHNPDGARVLAEYLEKYEQNKKIKFIFGCLANKEYNKILTKLYKKQYDFCFYEFDYPNALKYSQLGEFKNILRKIDDPFFEIEKNDYDVCVLTGSLYMLGEIFKGRSDILLN